MLTIDFGDKIERPERVAHEPPYRRAWIAHTHDCASCGYWWTGARGILAEPGLCGAGARLYEEFTARRDAWLAVLVVEHLRRLAGLPC